MFSDASKKRPERLFEALLTAACRGLQRAIGYRPSKNRGEIGRAGDKRVDSVWSWLVWAWPGILALIVAGVLVTFVAVSALIFIWAERKVSGRMQDRLGPTRVGGRFGWLQTLADGVKLVAKEDIIP